jgi:hypothetical protein
MFDEPLRGDIVTVEGREDRLSTRMVIHSLGELSRKLLSMILVDYDDKELKDDLPNLFICYAATYDPDSQDLQLPRVIKTPHKAADRLAGDFLPWADFEYSLVGDQSKLPSTQDNTVGAKGEYIEMIRDHRPDMPLVEKWRYAAAQAVDAFAPDEQPLTFEPPEITDPKSGVQVPPSLAEAAMRGKYKVRPPMPSDDEDSDSEVEAGDPSVGTAHLLENDGTLPSGIELDAALQDESSGKEPQQKANENSITPYSDLDAFEASQFNASCSASRTPRVPSYSRGKSSLSAETLSQSRPVLVDTSDSPPGPGPLLAAYIPQPGGVLIPHRSSPTISSANTLEANDEDVHIQNRTQERIRLQTRPWGMVAQAQRIEPPLKRSPYEAAMIATQERLQTQDEVESRRFHRTMGQQKKKGNGRKKGNTAPNSSHQASGAGTTNNKSKKDNNAVNKRSKRTQEEGRQAAISERWGKLPHLQSATNLPKESGALTVQETFMQAIRRSITSTDGPRDDISSHATEISSVETIQEAAKTTTALQSVLSGARRFTGQLNLMVDIVKLLFRPESVSRDQLKSNMSVHQYRKFLNPANAVKPAEIVLLDKVTTSGADCNFIVDLQRSDGTRLFDPSPYSFEVVYEFLCKTGSGELVVLTMYEVDPEQDAEGTVKYTLDRSTRQLGCINYHFSSHMWDAQLNVKATQPYEANHSQQEAALSFVDSVIVPGGKMARLFAQVPVKELEIKKIFMRRWTRFACRSPNANSKEKELPAESSVNGDDPQLPEFYLQITEKQELYWNARGSQIDAYAKANGNMVEDERLWYNIALGSSVADNTFLENANLSLGGVAEWREGDILDAGIAETLANIARRLVTRIDGVGFHNRGPYARQFAAQTRDTKGSVVTEGNKPPRTVGGAWVKENTPW